MEILPAEAEDLPEILALQMKAFQGEAALYGHHRIRPLRQTLAELVEEAKRSVILKAVQEGKIVGSIRLRLQAGTCHVGSVIVEPTMQNQGIGTKMLLAAEAIFPNVERYEIFTGEKSARNLYLYQKLGYKPFKTQAEDAVVNLIYLEKPPQSRQTPKSIGGDEK